MIAFISSTSTLFVPLSLLCLLLLLVPPACTLGIEFTVPAGGATLPPGPITVTWSDAGGDPDEAALVAYTLELIVGGNSQSNSEVIQTIGQRHGRVKDGAVQGDIAADIAQSIQNGFYMRMTSNTTTGDQVINYSDRFTLINMNGTTASTYLQGANAASGDSSNVPEAQYNEINPILAPTTTASAASTPTTPTGPATAPPSVEPGQQSSDMSEAHMAGLVTGGILALIGLVSLFIWAILIYRRMQRKHHNKEEKTEGQKEEEIIDRYATTTFIGHKAELAAHRTSGLHYTHTRELGSSQNERFEMNGLDKIAEAPASPIVYELEGSWMGWEASSGRKSKAYDPTR